MFNSFIQFIVDFLGITLVVIQRFLDPNHFAIYVDDSIVVGLKDKGKAVGMSFQSRNDLQEWSARVVERGTVMDFDLNCPPPDECIDPTGPHQEATQYYNHYQGQAMDNPEFVDEDIAIISPRKFAEVCDILVNNLSVFLTRPYKRINMVTYFLGQEEL